MDNGRRIAEVIKSKPTLEGAGVHLKRAFGFDLVPKLDPFLLLDDFHSDNPDHYIQGFPWHPHRGIETITYMLHGVVEHGDSMGNRGVIASGDVQWMTAGSGIIHQEMPKGREDGLMRGFQLWANLPATHKMMAPRYREIQHDQIPEVELNGGVRARVISGEVNGTKGPVQDIITDPEYLDVSIPANAVFVHRISPGYTAFAYIYEGMGYFDDARERAIDSESLVIFSEGDHVTISTAQGWSRFLLISGAPIGEPVAWRGPIVMNTQEELKVAFDEIAQGTFLKHNAAS